MVASTDGKAVEEEVKEVHEDREDEDGEVDLDLRSASDWLEEDAESTESERLASMPESEELRLTADLAASDDRLDEGGELCGAVAWNLW